MAPNHIHHRYYHQVLESFDQRLKASIVGVPVDELAKAADKPVLEPLPDILSRFEPYLGWLERPEVLTLRYEDFITDRQGAIRRVLEHALQRGFQLHCSKEQAARRLEESIDPQRSPTFRSGKVGGWRSAFTEEHERLFQQTAGELLRKLRYNDASY